MLDRDAAIALLVSRHPPLMQEINEREVWSGLLHVEIARFADYTQRQIDTGSRAELAACYESARQLLMDGDESVRNAVHVSYLEHLSFKDGKVARSWAKSLLPPALRQAHHEITEYMAALARKRR